MVALLSIACRYIFIHNSGCPAISPAVNAAPGSIASKLSESSGHIDWDNFNITNLNTNADKNKFNER
jgi:hypothetical protein